MAINRLQTDGVNPSPDRANTNLVSGSGILLTPADDSPNLVSKITVATRGPQTWVLNIPAMSALANSQSFKFTPGVAGRLIGLSFTSTTAITTAAKAATFQLKIAGTSTTGGTLALTSANATTTVGTEVIGTACTALNTFTAAQQISVDISGVTAFVEGAGQITVVFG